MDPKLTTDLGFRDKKYVFVINSCLVEPCNKNNQ